MDLQFYQIGVFLLITLFFFLYSVLDGFDLGIGMLLPFTRDKADRERLVSYIAPFWDGNEVWLVIVAGFIFGAFPTALGLVLGAFYLPLMLLISGFILRAMALEYSYHDIRRQQMWHMTAAWGSYIITALGLFVLGTTINGLPFAGPGVLSRNAVDYIAPFPVLFTLVGIIIVLWHGVTYALGHDESEALQTLARKLWWITAAATALLLAAWFIILPQTFKHPFTITGSVICFAGLVAGRILLNKSVWAFRFSCVSIAGLWLLISASQFPFVLQARHHPEWSLTLAENSAPLSTLQLLLKVGLIVMPLILAYSYFTYKVLRKQEGNQANRLKTENLT